VQLTEAARSCLPKLCEGFEALAAAVELIRERAAETELLITAPPVFTARWLFPRLADFAKREPRSSCASSPRARWSTPARSIPPPWWETST